MKKIVKIVVAIVILTSVAFGSWYAGTQYMVDKDRKDYLEMSDGDVRHIYLLGQAPDSYWILTREKIER